MGLVWPGGMFGRIVVVLIMFWECDENDCVSLLLKLQV